MNNPPQSVLTIKIDAGLARHYRDTYLSVFGTPEQAQVPIEEFIAQFVEDRLAEEVEFVEEEADTQTE